MLLNVDFEKPVRLDRVAAGVFGSAAFDVSPH